MFGLYSTVSCLLHHLRGDISFPTFFPSHKSVIFLFFFFFYLFASTALFHSPPLMLCLYVYCTPRDGYCHETELFSGFQQHIFVGTFLQKLSSVWKIKSRVREPARLVPQVQSKWSHFEHASPFSDGVKQHCGAVFLVEHQHFSSEDPTAGGCKDRAGLKTE